MLFFMDKDEFSIYFVPRRGNYAVSEIEWQGSSGVEQRTHKPFVGSSNLPPATNLSLASFK